MRDDRRAAVLEHLTVADARTGAPLVDDVEPDRPRGRGRRASPASRATARPNWSTRSWACGRCAGGHDRSLGARGHHRLEHPCPARGRASGFIPEDRHRQGMLLDAPLWENRILGHQTRPPAVKGSFIDRRGGPRRHRADHAGVRRPGPRPGHPRRRPVRRQPAEAHRRARDERRPAAADRRPPDPRRRRRRAGGRSGSCSRTPAPKGWGSC